MKCMKTNRRRFLTIALCFCLVLYTYLQKDPTDQTCVSFLSASCITPRHLNSSLVVAVRLRKRRDRVKKACREEHYPNTFSMTLRRLNYAPSHNLFVCSPPKVASTTWLRHLYNMAGLNPSIDQIHNKKWINKVSAMEVLGKNATVRRLKSSVTVMTARHPLARLVSAFRDKFADGRKLDKPQSKDHFIYFWSPALKALYRNTNMPLQINFTQFVTFALLHKPHEPHWEPFTKLCSPCDISYQYIIFLDTLTEDLQFLMSALNISTINSKTRDNRGSNNSTYRPREGVDPSDDLTLDPDLLQYYLQLPPYLMAKVLYTYTLDIKLLGYQVPEVLNAIAT